MYTIENSVAEKIISDFKKFGYNAKLKSAIYRCKGMSCFGGILRRISINCDELISCIFDDKEIKLGYDELKSLKTFQRKDWINRNKKDKNSLIQKTISKLQADLNAEEIEMARHDDVQWAVYQYMNGFGGTNDDIMNPDGIAWVFNRQEVLPSNNGKGKTAEEIIVNELKNGGEYLATYLLNHRSLYHISGNGSQIHFGKFVHITSADYTTIIGRIAKRLGGQVDNKFSGFLYHMVGMTLRSDGNGYHRGITANRSCPCHRKYILLPLLICRTH